MNKYKLNFNHLGLAVKDKSDAILFLKNLGYNIQDEIFESEQNVNIIMCTSEKMPNVEIIYGADNDKKSPLKSILKEKQELIYHMCYETGNIKESLDLIEKDNIRVICISQPKKSIIFKEKFISFYYIKGFGLIEIIHS